jgi:hypothetical protein
LPALIGFTARSPRHTIRIFPLCVLVSGKCNGYAGKEVAVNCAKSKTVEEVWISVKVAKIESDNPLSQHWQSAELLHTRLLAVETVS